MRMDIDALYSFLFSTISEKRSDAPFVIAFDGRSASGKTTIADKIARDLKIPIVHTDDFFRPRNQFGEIELSEFSGNFDLERFEKEVVTPLKDHLPIEYGVFDCKEGKITSKNSIKDYSCILVEGAYSLHPELGDYADLKVFFDIESDVQSERIKKRNGETALLKFNELWIPSEERYIKYYKIDKLCDIIVNGGK